MKTPIMTLAALGLLGAQFAWADAHSEVEAISDLLVEDDTGTDPRDFGDKLMPYYLHTELENGMEVDQLNLFGFWAITPNWGLTYDMPIVKRVQIDKEDIANIVSGEIGTGIEPDELGIKDIDETGLGDLNLRTFVPIGRTGKVTWLAGAETNLPTHSDDVLGADVWTAGPMIVDVIDLDFLPMPGAFFAQMHIFQWDIAKDSDESSVGMYKGRWFLMVPVHEQWKLYTLTEMQPVYDFYDDEFSFWIAPEFGKATDWGAVYFKPGFGIDNDQHYDREWTLELGLRYFFK
ncbi:MAG: hypothetical protein ACPGES_06025 [Coraliomargarita sp.]